MNDFFLLCKLVLSSFFLLRGFVAVIKDIFLLGKLEISSVFFLLSGLDAVLDGSLGWIKIIHFCLGRPRLLSFGVKYIFV